jgi:hypothetical protein
MLPLGLCVHGLWRLLAAQNAAPVIQCVHVLWQLPLVRLLLQPGRRRLLAARLFLFSPLRLSRAFQLPQAGSHVLQHMPVCACVETRRLAARLLCSPALRRLLAARLLCLVLDLQLPLIRRQ